MTLDARIRLQATQSEGETTWISRARDGDQHAFHALYQRHVGHIYRLCLHLCADTSCAEEMTQEAFIRAWQKLDQLDDKQRFGAWLKRLTINLVLDSQHRKRHWWQRWRPVQEQDHPQIADNPGIQRDLEGLLSRLPDRARQVFVLFAVEGLSHREISELMGTEESTSKAQYHRARKLLQEWWQ